MVTPGVREQAAHREPGVPGADDDRVDAGHGFAVLSGERPAGAEVLAGRSLVGDWVSR